jgi:hypothetical protein
LKKYAPGRGRQPAFIRAAHRHIARTSITVQDEGLVMLAAMLVIGVIPSGSPEPRNVPCNRTIKLPAVRRIMRLPPKYEDEVVDYAIDWADRIGWPRSGGVELITSVLVSALGDVTTSPGLAYGQMIAFWVAGGRSGNGSQISCKIEMTSGRTLEEVLTIRCF